eukprot:979370_1
MPPVDTAISSPCDTAAASPCDTAVTSPCDTAAASPCDTAAASPCDTAVTSPCDTAAASPCDTAAASSYDTAAASTQSDDVAMAASSTDEEILHSDFDESSTDESILSDDDSPWEKVSGEDCDSSRSRTYDAVCKTEPHTPVTDPRESQPSFRSSDSDSGHSKHLKTHPRVFAAPFATKTLCQIFGTESADSSVMSQMNSKQKRPSSDISNHTDLRTTLPPRPQKLRKVSKKPENIRLPNFRRRQTSSAPTPPARRIVPRNLSFPDMSLSPAECNSLPSCRPCSAPDSRPPSPDSYSMPVPDLKQVVYSMPVPDLTPVVYSMPEPDLKPVVYSLPEPELNGASGSDSRDECTPVGWTQSEDYRLLTLSKNYHGTDPTRWPNMCKSFPSRSISDIRERHEYLSSEVGLMKNWN